MTVKEKRMYQRVNRRTGEVITGTFDEICDLDIRLWDYAEPARQSDKMVTMESTVFSPYKIGIATYTLPVKELLPFLTKSAALKRIQTRNMNYELLQRIIGWR